MKEQPKFDWCIKELEENLLANDWVFEAKDEEIPSRLPIRWLINKDSYKIQIKFYWNTYQCIAYSGACQILGTRISLDFLEIHQQASWLKSLQGFIEDLNNNFNSMDFGGHILDDMTPEQGIEIAKKYIDGRESIKITGQTQFMSNWYNHDYPVWIVFADNLSKSPIIDGVSTYSIVISIKTREVKDMILS